MFFLMLFLAPPWQPTALRPIVTVTPVVPTFTSVAPSSGDDGLAVVITGTNFASGATVTFDGQAATSIVVASATTINCNVPTHADGTVDIIITNPNTESVTASGAFTYTSIAAPTFTSVLPVSGDDGLAVVITGTNFVSGAAVTFDGSSATSIVVASSTTINCDVPAHADDIVDIIITNPDTKSVTASSAFTYVSGITATVTSISRDVGSAAGGTSVNITGTDFAGGATVSVGGTAATSIVVNSTTSITCTFPAHATGLVDVTVTNSGAAAGSLQASGAYGWEYLPTPTTTYITHDFEDGTLGDFGTDFNDPVAWDNWHCSSCCGGGTVACEPGWDHSVPIHYSGTFCAKARKGDGSDGAAKLVKDFTGDAITNPPLEATGLYQRWYGMLPQNSLDIAATPTGAQIKLHLSRGTPGAWLHCGTGTQFSGDFDDEFVAFKDEGGSLLPESTGFIVKSVAERPSKTGFRIQADTWHEFQTWYFHDGVNGRARLWIDGKEMFDVTSPDLGSGLSTAAHRFEIGVAWVQGNTGTTATSVYVDDVALADGYIEPVPDTSSP